MKKRAKRGEKAEEEDHIEEKNLRLMKKSCFWIDLKVTIYYHNIYKIDIYYYDYYYEE